jgi:drug/metabolite transporter (DMT)-like permease
MHQTTGRWQLGLILALITTVMWGMLPIALKILLFSMDPYTLTWYRFLAATLVLGIWLLAKGDMPGFRDKPRFVIGLLVIAVVGLSANFVLYIVGLDSISPGTAQIVIQLAPMFLLVGGLVFFKERFSRRQWTGFVILSVGLLLFFNRRLAELFTVLGSYTIGVLFIVVASITWAAYALAQKQLLRDYSSAQVMFIIFLVALIAFYVPTELGQIKTLDASGIAILVFASINTLIAYGCFAEALNHWEASRLSAVLAITP